MQKKHVISCDWGTSSLRLQLIDAVSQKCLAKVSSNQGNAVIFNEWKSQANPDRVEFYLKHLQPLLSELSSVAGVSLDGLYILISGMASSSVGMKELPYVDVPFNLDGSSAYAEKIEVKSIIGNPIILISGVQQADDVMRGEETQLIGIASLFKFPADDNAVFILPGTHSKHIAVTNNSISHFKTFMTGEIFDTLTKYTVLSHAVSDPIRQTVNENNEDISRLSSLASRPFNQGVSKALSTELLNSLFAVRINHLKKYLSAEQNYFYLSGLLIGSELKYMSENNQKLVLCSSGRLLQLYQLAIDCAGLSKRTVILPAELLDNAAAAGQLKILNNINSI
jgi:2-dehydro-3-deoxygalactonokinase